MFANQRSDWPQQDRQHDHNQAENRKGVIEVFVFPKANPLENEERPIQLKLQPPIPIPLEADVRPAVDFAIEQRTDLFELQQFAIGPFERIYADGPVGILGDFILTEQGS